MSDQSRKPIDIANAFEEANALVDKILKPAAVVAAPLSETTDLVEEILANAKKRGAIESWSSRTMLKDSSFTEREKYHIKAPKFDARYGGRKSQPLADYSIVVGRDHKGMTHITLKSIGVTCEGVFYEYGRHAKKRAIVNKPFIFEDIKEESTREYLGLLVENMVYAGRRFTQKAAQVQRLRKLADAQQPRL